MCKQTMNNGMMQHKPLRDIIEANMRAEHSLSVFYVHYVYNNLATSKYLSFSHVTAFPGGRLYDVRSVRLRRIGSSEALSAHEEVELIFKHHR